MKGETRIKEVVCKTALSPCGLPGFDYSLNPYRGCGHGCVYCYSPAVIRETREWGTFVDVKVNIPNVLAKELGRKREGIIWLGSVCDAYQPAEERFALTRKCLRQLLRVDWSISLLTKSSLSARDFDLMADFSDFDLGYSITSDDDSLRRKMEPGASSVDERLEAMARASDRGLDPWAFIAPIIPGRTDRVGDMESLIEALADAGVERVGFDPFRYKSRCWPRMREFLGEGSVEDFKEALRSPEHFLSVARTIEQECSKRGMKLVA